MQREAAEPEQLADGAEALASDARLLLEAGRLRGAALLHAEACALLLRALRTASGVDADADAGPASLPRADTLATRLRAVWLDRPGPLHAVPRDADLRAMADGLRALVPAVRARVAPEPEPEPETPPEPKRAPTSVRLRPAPIPAPARKPAPSRKPAPAPTREPEPPRAEPARTQPPRPAPQPAAPPASHRPVSSAAFWSLIDRWGVADADALALLGHAGGLTRRGTRPRFRLVGDEIERFHLLQTLDDALAALGQAPRGWLQAAVDTPPFKGAAPLDAMLRGGEPTLRAATRALVGEGLRRSLA